MGLSSTMNLNYPINSLSNPVINFSNSNAQSCIQLRSNFAFSRLKASASQPWEVGTSVSCSSENNLWLKLPQVVVKVFGTSAILIGLGAFSFSISNKGSTATALAAINETRSPPRQAESIAEDAVPGRNLEDLDDEQLHEEFEKWKSKTYALNVPLRVVALQGSVPPAWIKDFIRSQGRRSKLSVQFRGTLENIFSELSRSSNEIVASPKSAITADLVTIGDSWLDSMIGKSIIEPMQIAEDSDWFRGLPEKWKIYLRRNNEGQIDPKGRIWAVPYRWGSMVIAYKKSKFDKLGLAPIEDWKDLWRPELAGRISMVNSPREVIGVVLKYMGASYNTSDISKEIPGGISAVQHNLSLLAKQVLLFDSANYLKAFNVGDTWVAVGWSSDILPAAKRLSNVAVVAPKSGSSLWADLWAIPSLTGYPSNEKLGGRIRGPSPLIHQWLDFCLQPARELPFKQGVFPGALPSALENVPAEVELKGAPKLVTNLVSGVPPPEILCKCEFLEPLSETALSDYKLLISSIEKPSNGLREQFCTPAIRAIRMKISSLRKEK